MSATCGLILDSLARVQRKLYLALADRRRGGRVALLSANCAGACCLRRNCERSGAKFSIKDIPGR